ncbi:MAG: universal stress protein [Gemmatimonadaceae bacterium]|jgi:nucleotide-binding universal stress UspA family protein|nr:universal stress protein [Gemmatimonadaceae bacterium]
MAQPILVPLDGSAFAEAALPAASALARTTNSPLAVCLVHDPSAYIRFAPSDVAIPPHDAPLMRQLVDEQRAYLERVVARLRDAGLTASAHWMEGTVIEAISDKAVQQGAWLIVLTTHGRGGLERLWIGSVASSLIQRASTPLLLVRPAATPQPLEALALDAEGARRTLDGPVLVPLDGSAFAEQVLPLAQRVAQASGNRLALFQVVEPHAVRLAPFGAEALLADDLSLVNEEKEAREYLDRLVHRLSLPDAPRMVVTDMSAARAILDEVSRTTPSMVALATHGRSGFSRVLLGSVADKLLRSIDRPLLVYRPRER